MAVAPLLFKEDMMEYDIIPWVLKNTILTICIVTTIDMFIVFAIAWLVAK